MPPKRKITAIEAYQRQILDPETPLEQLKIAIALVPQGARYKNGYGFSALHAAVLSDPKKVAYLLQCNADPNVCYERGEEKFGTPLHLSLAQELPDETAQILDLIIGPETTLNSSGYDFKSAHKEPLFNLATCDGQGKNLLLLAAKLMSPLVGRILRATLYQNPALINQPDEKGTTALQTACALGQLETARLLLEAKGDVNYIDLNLRTTLDYCSMPAKDVATILSEVDIDPRRSCTATRNTLVLSNTGEELTLATLPKNLVETMDLEINKVPNYGIVNDVDPNNYPEILWTERNIIVYAINSLSQIAEPFIYIIRTYQEELLGSAEMKLLAAEILSFTDPNFLYSNLTSPDAFAKILSSLDNDIKTILNFLQPSFLREGESIVLGGDYEEQMSQLKNLYQYWQKAEFDPRSILQKCMDGQGKTFMLLLNYCALIPTSSISISMHNMAALLSSSATAVTKTMRFPFWASCREARDTAQAVADSSNLNPRAIDLVMQYIYPQA